MQVKVTTHLIGFPKTGPIQKAIANGLNEGGDKVRTQVQRALKTQTGVKKYSSITSRMSDSGKGWARAAPGRLAYIIVATGKGIPIQEFPASLTTRGASAKSWGVAHLFKRSFGLHNSKDPSQFRARTTSKRFPIRKLYGPSLPKELVQGQSIETFERSAADIVPAMVIKRLGHVLG